MLAVGLVDGAQRLHDLADRLEAEGYEVQQLRVLEQEFEALERPPGLWSRMTDSARSSAARHWSALVGELIESKEAMAIIMTRLKGRNISPEEREKVRAQLVDLMKMFPAGLIAAANSALPVPGTGLFTPWILARLGLMPSRWRETYLLEQLRRERDRLEASGRHQCAVELDVLRQAIEDDASARETIGNSARLLTRWDANDNGVWDPDEREAYRAELQRMRRRAQRFATRKQWYLDVEGEIYGALRLTELLEDEEVRAHLEDEELLVCFDGKTGWIALPHLLGREPRL